MKTLARLAVLSFFSLSLSFGAARTVHAEEPIPPQAPAGYHYEQSSRMEVAGPGIAVLALSYGPSFTFGAIGAASGGFGLLAAPLMVPVAGPLIVMSTWDVTGEARAWLIADSIVQFAGLSMIIGGVASKKLVLVRNDGLEVEVRPIATPQGAGIGLGGKF